jgi:hypothetical protein
MLQVMMEGEAPRQQRTWNASAARHKDPGPGESRQARTRRSEAVLEVASATAAAATGSGCVRRRYERRLRAEGSAARSATSEARRSAETRGERMSSPRPCTDAASGDRTCWRRRWADAEGSGAGRDKSAEATPRLPRRTSRVARSRVESGEGAAANAPVSSAAMESEIEEERWRRRRRKRGRRGGGFMADSVVGAVGESALRN